jgi:hypothetical protein
VWSAIALTRSYITTAVIRATEIAVACFTSFFISVQSIIFGSTLIAITSDYVSFADTLSCVYIATKISNCPVLIACTGFTSLRIGFNEIPESRQTSVATPSFNIFLAVTLSGL